MAVPSLVYLSAPHYSAFFDVVHSPDAGKVRLVSEGYVNLTFLLQPLPWESWLALLSTRHACILCFGSFCVSALKPAFSMDDALILGESDFVCARPALPLLTVYRKCLQTTQVLPKFSVNKCQGFGSALQSTALKSQVFL